MAEEEEVELTLEEKLDEAESLILQSPPGQAKFLADDVSSLIHGGLPADKKEAIFHKHNIASSLVVPTGDSHVVIAEEGQIAPNAFVNTKTKAIVRVSHADQEAVTDAEAGDAPEDFFDAALEAHRTSLLVAAGAHVEALHKTASVKGYEVYSKDGKLTLVISALAKNFKNFWAGLWRSKYTITVAGESAEVVGNTSISTHYYENGNVQMNNSKDFASTVAFGTADNLGAAVMRAIAAQEDDLQTSLEEMYENMAGQTLKEIRRFLPLSAKKFEWNIHALKMRQKLFEQRK